MHVTYTVAHRIVWILHCS